MFIFYDTETTGINSAFDQILQFAAILTDEKLVEIERFDIRCQLLPWVVPSPTALLVTKTPASTLRDKTLPTFFEMMSAVYAKLCEWSPATFIGYNSIAFDEQFLHRALWQTLHPPYLTVTNNNKRCDLLTMLRVASHFFPNSFIWPKKTDGKMTMKLDQLAPINGFNHLKAHDALNDVEASIFLAKNLFEKLPDLWTALIMRSSKHNAAAVAMSDKPILVFESQKGVTSAWFGQNLERHQSRLISKTTLAKLEYAWHGFVNNNLLSRLAEAKKNTTQVSFNKSPPIFTLEEAKQLFGLEPSKGELFQSNFLNNNESVCNEIASAIKAEEKIWPESEEIEQRIYQGFPSKKDEILASSYRKSSSQERYKISSQFTEQKYRELASRLLYLNNRETLTDEEVAKIQNVIVNRLKPPATLGHSWRSIADAVKELSDPKTLKLGSKEEIYSLKQWYLSLSSFPLDTDVYRSS